MNPFKRTGGQLDLLPHHIVNFVDIYRLGEDTTSYREYYWRGPGVESRVKEIIEKLSVNPDTKVRIVTEAKKDFVCSQASERKPRCVWLTNISISKCASPDTKKKEKEIADEMGIKIGKEYPFSELIRRRDQTPFRKERE